MRRSCPKSPFLVFFQTLSLAFFNCAAGALAAGRQRISDRDDVEEGSDRATFSPLNNFQFFQKPKSPQQSQQQ